MKLNNKLFKKQGYIHIEDVIPTQLLKLARREAINLKRNKVSELGKDREWGTGTYWRGIEMASKLNENLMMCYINPFMQQIVPVFLETQNLWLFNDQVVVKLPNEDFIFPEHHDNQYGPDPEGALNGDFQTINFMWVLTNCSKESGALEIKNNKTGEWDLIEAKAGDMIAVDGNTLHRSGKNTTDKPRAMYACIFSNKKLIFKGFYERKWRFCNCRDGLKNHKLHEEDQKLWEKHLKK
jgi:ectoine hydroxylase-related dioxygenase (phytanoyl-CoA dioxygenase family)